LNLDEQSEARGAESASIPDVPELSATVGDVEQVTSNHRGFGAGRGGPPPVVFTGAPAFRTKSIAGVPWRFGVFRNEAISATFGLNQGEVAAELKRIRDVFWMSLPFVLLMVGLGGWHVAARALRPLKTIAQTAEHVTARGLDQRIPQTKTTQKRLD
jgi:hypothetical protein